MKRISFALVAALALVVNACEKHSAEVTSSALHTTHDAGHGEATHEGAAKGHATERIKANPEPFTPKDAPSNPSGSAVTDPHDPAKDKGTGGSGDPGAYKYFPNSGKK